MNFFLSLVIGIVDVILIKVFLGFAWPAAIILGLLLGFTMVFVLKEVDALNWFD